MNKDLYESIYKRKSTRKFKTEPLADCLLSEILEKITLVQPLLSDCEVDLSVVSGHGIKNAFGVKAPHYLVVSAKEQKGALMNVGYMLQQVDLYLSKLGVGGC